MHLSWTFARLNEFFRLFFSQANPAKIISNVVFAFHLHQPLCYNNIQICSIKTQSTTLTTSTTSTTSTVSPSNIQEYRLAIHRTHLVQTFVCGHLHIKVNHFLIHHNRHWNVFFSQQHVQVQIANDTFQSSS